MPIAVLGAQESFVAGGQGGQQHAVAVVEIASLRREPLPARRPATMPGRGNRVPASRQMRAAAARSGRRTRQASTAGTPT